MAACCEGSFTDIMRRRPHAKCWSHPPDLGMAHVYAFRDAIGEGMFQVVHVDDTEFTCSRCWATFRNGGDTEGLYAFFYVHRHVLEAAA